MKERNIFQNKPTDHQYCQEFAKKIETSGCLNPNLYLNGDQLGLKLTVFGEVQCACLCFSLAGDSLEQCTVTQEKDYRFYYYDDGSLNPHPPHKTQCWLIDRNKKVSENKHTLLPIQPEPLKQLRSTLKETTHSSHCRTHCIDLCQMCLLCCFLSSMAAGRQEW